jgi:hypothetical protein
MLRKQSSRSGREEAGNIRRVVSQIGKHIRTFVSKKGPISRSPTSQISSKSCEFCSHYLAVIPKRNR